MLGWIIILVILLVIVSALGFVCWRQSLQYNKMLEEYSAMYGTIDVLTSKKKMLQKEGTSQFCCCH